MCEDLLRQPPPLCLVKPLVEAHNPATSLQTVPRHFQLVHCMDILDVQLDARPVGCLCCPHIQVLMSARLEIQRVVAVVQVGKFREEVQLGFGVQFRVWKKSELRILSWQTM